MMRFDRRTSRARIATRALVAAAAAGALGLVPAPSARADEGMWTFDNPPVQRLKEVYAFTPDSAWFDHVRMSSVRFNSGGSGSFVSANGLVMTNHHVGFESIQKLSTPEKDLVKNGFYAGEAANELKCPDLELNMLVNIDDVTARVTGAVKPEMTGAQANAARKAEIAAIQKEEAEKTGMRCDVVALYRGGEYHLYRYKKFTDIRLVLCPEQQTAFYGGDPDNFTFPRYDLDVTFFRVYENGQPYAPKHFLAWNPEGCKEGDLVFVSGHPGSTGRMNTFAQMDFLRTTQYPRSLKALSAMIAALRKYSARGPEEARRAKDTIFGMSNSQKAFTGYLGGLEDPRILARKQAEEKELITKLGALKEASPAPAGDPKEPSAKPAETALAEYQGALDAITAAYKKLGEYTNRLYWSRLQGDSPGKALHLVRLATELPKPNGERLPEYTDSGLDSLKLGLFSTAPIHLDMDEVLLATNFELALKELGPEDPFIKAALGGKSPAEAAKTALAGTKLADPAERRKLFDGGKAAIDASTDSLIVLARTVDPILRELRKRYEEDVESVESQNGEKIARARFKAYGKSQPPDATFTLRLSYGVVKGYEQGTTLVPWKTTFNGLYERSASFDNKGPFELPKRWIDKRAAVALDTPFDFVCTTDIIGGNSGSPVIGKDGRLVGIIFDGNIQSLSNRFVYDEVQARAVAVHSAGIVMALRQVFDAGALVDELLAK
jgi:peptidase S46-like protein